MKRCVKCEEFKEQLTDMLAFIRYCFVKGKTDSYILSQIAHDLKGIVFEEDCFVPRTAGYSTKI